MEVVISILGLLGLIILFSYIFNSSSPRSKSSSYSSWAFIPTSSDSHSSCDSSSDSSSCDGGGCDGGC